MSRALKGALWKRPSATIRAPSATAKRLRRPRRSVRALARGPFPTGEASGSYWAHAVRWNTATASFGRARAACSIGKISYRLYTFQWVPACLFRVRGLEICAARHQDRCSRHVLYLVNDVQTGVTAGAACAGRPGTIGPCRRRRGGRRRRPPARSIQGLRPPEQPSAAHGRRSRHRAVSGLARAPWRRRNARAAVARAPSGPIFAGGAKVSVRTGEPLATPWAARGPAWPFPARGARRMSRVWSVWRFGPRSTCPCASQAPARAGKQRWDGPHGAAAAAAASGFLPGCRVRAAPGRHERARPTSGVQRAGNTAPQGMERRQWERGRPRC